MDQIILFIAEYGYVTILIAISINIVTGIVKLPIKALVKKLKNGERYTRFVIFLPIILGFVITLLFEYFLGEKPFIFNNAFFTQWLSSTSLSLAIYAMFEKVFPKKKKIMLESEILENQVMLKKIKDNLNKSETDCKENLDE